MDATHGPPNRGGLLHSKWALGVMLRQRVGALWHRPSCARRDISRELDRSWVSPRRSARSERVLTPRRRGRGSWRVTRIAQAIFAAVLARALVVSGLLLVVWSDPDDGAKPTPYYRRCSSVVRAQDIPTAPAASARSQGGS